ncbi:MAG: asparagine synthase-related protein [Bacteroidales bacterium]|nr:asparagine synthase-related protein [Bacteroidales bacterium]
MRKPVRADAGLLVAMVQTFPATGHVEEIAVNRFALAAMNDPAGEKSINGSPVYRDQEVAGTYDGRIDHATYVPAETNPASSADPATAPSANSSANTPAGPSASSAVKFPFTIKNNLSDASPDKYIYKSLFSYVLRYILKYIYQDPKGLRGDFAVSAYDIREDRLVLARDPLGTRPLYYLEQSDYIAFATEMKALKALPGFVPEVDETWIADALSTVQSEQWRTPYKGIQRLLPGHLLVFDHTLRQERYWDLEVDEDVAGLGYDKAVELFREKLYTAIDRRIKDDRVIAAELSGGLDSSGVTAIANQLAKQSGQSFVALTHAFSDKSLGMYFPYSDEREFSMEVCRFTGLEEQIMCDADGYGLLDMLKRNILIHSGPTQQGYSMFSDTLYDRGRERGVSKLLSGFGGDEGVTSKASGFFEELAAGGRWELFRREFFLRGSHPGIQSIARPEKQPGRQSVAQPGKQPGRQPTMQPGTQRGAQTGAHSGSLSGIKTLTGRMRQEAAYLVYRYFPFAKKFLRGLLGRPDWRAEKYPGLGFTKEFEERMGIEQRFYQRLGFPDDPNVRDRQYKRIMHDHVSQRFEYSYLDAKAWGIEYAYPLWDIDLLEFYYSLPPEYKFRNGIGRAIYRDAMKGLLPEKIRLRNDKTGATVPTVQQRFLDDDEKITALIKRSREHNRYHYLDYDRLQAWQERFRKRSSKAGIPGNPAAFFNSLQILLLQEMEREGTYRSGIRW